MTISDKNIISGSSKPVRLHLHLVMIQLILGAFDDLKAKFVN